jgi:hypothetical protein
VDGPEGESLGFDNIPDAYRSLSGPAQLSGKRDISSEVGAVFQPAYSQTIPELLLSIKKSYAGGLTMMVIHGMAYSGPYAQTTWPGYQPFSYGTTDSWSRIQPAWRHMDDVLGYLGRNQHILKSGKPRIDLAIYQSNSAWTAARIYDSDNLQAKGLSGFDVSRMKDTNEYFQDIPTISSGRKTCNSQPRPLRTGFSAPMALATRHWYFLITPRLMKKSFPRFESSIVPDYPSSSWVKSSLCPYHPGRMSHTTLLFWWNS